VLPEKKNGRHNIIWVMKICHDNNHVRYPAILDTESSLILSPFCNKILRTISEIIRAVYKVTKIDK